LYIQRFNYHTLGPYLAQLLKRKKFILDLDDWEIREDPKYYFGLYPSSKAHFFTREIAKKSACCIAASMFLYDFLSDFNKNVYYIPTGVDTDLFFPRKSSTDTDTIIFSWIGTLHKKEYIENLDFALNCFNALKDKYPKIRFEITGDGIYRQDLEMIIFRNNDSRVTFKPWIDPDKVPAYLASIDIGLFPVAERNKFNLAKSPTKLFEYMAMAKPVVASSFGEPRHIIDDGANGFLADSKDEFSAKMQSLVEDRRLRQALGDKARAKIEENFSLSVLGKRLRDIVINIR
jgi:glycosyltransferase involved in cell wall biosynthesis